MGMSHIYARITDDDWRMVALMLILHAWLELGDLVRRGDRVCGDNPRKVCLTRKSDQTITFSKRKKGGRRPPHYRLRYRLVNNNAQRVAIIGYMRSVTVFPQVKAEI